MASCGEVSLRLRSYDGLVERPDTLDTGQTEARSGMVSIVIPCFGQLEFTQLLVPSLLQHNSSPFELIFVDADSLDGTTEYLAGLQAAMPSQVTVARVRDDLGMAAAYGEGITWARGRYVVLLSNDTIVTNGWLEQLIALVELDPTIGAVGPMSNCADPPQLVHAIPYRLKVGRDFRVVTSETTLRPRDENEPLGRFATLWREQNRGKWFEVDRLDPFCILFKRELIAALSPLFGHDYQASKGSRSLGLDSEELCSAIRRTGARLACCNDLFIHYFKSKFNQIRKSVSLQPNSVDLAI